jgi:hypothetical protein
MTSLEEIQILSINELEGVEGGGIVPESTKFWRRVQMKAKRQLYRLKVPEKGKRKKQS